MRITTYLISVLGLAGISACSPPAPPIFGHADTLAISTVGEVSGPRLTSGPDGHLTLSWMEQRDELATLRFATLSDTGFSAAQDVVDESRMFVNWADVPSVLHVDAEHWFAHWLRYSADKTYSYDVVASQSFDGGQSWSAPVPIHTDGTPTEHGFVSTFRADDGVSLLWLDGRETPEQPMTLRSAVLTTTGERAHEQLVDESVCDCCQTDIAVSSLGPLAVYRDRTPDEIRDIYITRHDGERWEEGERLYPDNWKIPGCPVNGPSIVADGNAVAIAWFSAASDHPVVRLIRSSDGGMNFQEPVIIAEGRIAGYVGLALLPNRYVAVSWVVRNESGNNTLFAAVIDPAGKISAVESIDEISQLRVFPQLGYQDGHLVFAWTDQRDDHRSLHVTRHTIALP